MAYEEGRRIGLEEARNEGRVEGWKYVIALFLEAKFGPPSIKLLRKVNDMHDSQKLESLYAALLSTTTLSEVRRLLR